MYLAVLAAILGQAMLLAQPVLVGYAVLAGMDFADSTPLITFVPGIVKIFEDALT